MMGPTFHDVGVNTKFLFAIEIIKITPTTEFNTLELLVDILQSLSSIATNFSEGFTIEVC